MKAIKESVCHVEFVSSKGWHQQAFIIFSHSAALEKRLETFICRGTSCFEEILTSYWRGSLISF